MITLGFDSISVRANAISPVVEEVLAVDANGMEVRPLGRGIALDPVREWNAAGVQVQSSSLTLKVPMPDSEWSVENERRFVVLAEKEAIGQLMVDEKKELERLSISRRITKNPRPGEELVLEYEQRQLTRGLIEALDKYVSFHKAAHSAEYAEA